MKNIINIQLPDGYDIWRKEIIFLIEQAKYNAILNVNAELLALYWKIGRDIIQKQDELGWGKQVIIQLSKDLMARFPDDKGYSERNLGYMKQFAREYPDFPILQVPLAKFQKNPIWQVALAKFINEEQQFVQVPLAQITWYHHISLIPKVKDLAERAMFIIATAQEGWSRDVMLLQVANGYINAATLKRFCRLKSLIWFGMRSKTHTILVFWERLRFKMSVLSNCNLPTRLRISFWRWAGALPLLGGSIILWWMATIITLTF